MKRYRVIFDGIIEAAVAGACDFVVSFNERHLRVASRFGVQILNARAVA